MVRMEDLYRALIAADAAGDVEAARKLAEYIRQQEATEAPSPVETPETTIGGQVKEALKGLVPGAVGLGETAITGAAALLPEEQEQAVRRAVSEVAEPIRELFAPEAGYEETTGRKLGEAIGSTLPFFPLGALGAAGRIAATGLGVGAGAGEARLRAEEEGATEDERGLATALGIGPGALEALPPVRILRRFGFGDEALTEVAKSVPVLRRIAVDGGEEALQEASSQVLQNLIAKGVYAPETSAFGGVGEAAALGGGTGAIISAVMELAIGRRSRGAAPSEEPPVDEELDYGTTPPIEPKPEGELLALPAPRTAGYKVDSKGNVVPMSEAEVEEGARLSSQFRALGLGEAEAIAARMQDQRERGFLTGIEDKLRASEEAADQEAAAKDDLAYVRSLPMAQLPLSFEGDTAEPVYVDMSRGDTTEPDLQKTEVSEDQTGFFFSSAPIDQLPPKQRVLRVMSDPKVRKTTEVLRSRTGIADSELKTTLAELRDEGVIAYKPGKFEWELTPEGAESVRTGTRTKPARAGRGPALSVSRPRAGEPGVTGVGQGRVAGVGGVPTETNVGETEVAAPLEPTAPSNVVSMVQRRQDQIDDEEDAEDLAEYNEGIVSGRQKILTYAPIVDTVRAFVKYGQDILNTTEYPNSLEAAELRRSLPYLQQIVDEFEVVKTGKGVDQDFLRNWYGNTLGLTQSLERLSKNRGELDSLQRFAEEIAPRPKLKKGQKGISRVTQIRPAPPATPPVDRMALIRRAAEKSAARGAIDEVESRRSTLRTQAIEAFDNDQINEKAYTAITEELKKSVPNFARVTSLLEGTAKPKREKDVGLKFQRGEVSGTGRVSKERVKSAVDNAIRGWTNRPKVVVAENAADPAIPEDVRRDLPADAKGVYANGTVYAIADRATDEAGVRGTVFHEALGHYGLEQEFQGKLAEQMEAIYKGNPTVRAAADARMKRDDSLDIATAVEEVLAEKSEAGPIKEGPFRAAFNRIAAFIRNFMRSKGLMSSYSDNDVRQIIQRAHNRVIQGRKAEYDPFDPRIRYQRSPKEQMAGDRRFVKSILDIPNNMPKATKEGLEQGLNAVSKLTPATRRGLFSMLTVHQLAQMFRKYTPALDNLWSTLNAEGVALRDREQLVSDNLNKWNSVMEKYSPAERERIYDLMLKTTVEKTTVKSKDKKGKEVEKEVFGVEVLDLVDAKRDIKWTADKNHPLYKDFMKLDPAVRQMYKELRLAYLDYALGVEKQLEQYLTPTEWQKLQSELNERRLRVYLPLFRSGDYKLTYTDKDGEYVSRLFNSPRELRQAAEEVSRTGAKDIQETTRDRFDSGDIPPTSFFGKVVGTLRKKDVPEEIVREVFDTYMDYLPANSVLQLSRRREGTAGYEKNVLQAYANIAPSYARRLTNMEFMPRIEKDYQQFKVDISNSPLDFSVKGDLTATLDKQLEYIRNPGLNSAYNKLGYFSYVMYLGGNLSTAIINVTDLAMTTLSTLGGRYGFTKASQALIRAGGTFFSKDPPADIKKLLEEGRKSGVLREQQLNDIAQFKSANSQMEKVKAGVDYMVNLAFAKSDMFNRETALIAAYELSKAKRGKVSKDAFDPDAFKDAEREVYNAFGSSFPKAGPPIMKHGLARVALTFKRFAINRVWLLYSAYKEAVAAETDPQVQKELRRAGRQTLLGYFGTAYVFAGVQGMPVVGVPLLLAALMNDDEDDPYDAEAELKKAIGLFNYKGPVNYAFGVDIASRTGWTNMFWREDPKRMAEVGPVTYTMEQFLGPAYSYAVGLPRAAEYLAEGQTSRAIEQLSPRAIGNIFKGIRYMEEGAYTANGMPLVKDVSTYNGFMQIFGFRPSDVAEAGEEAGAAKGMEKEIRSRRNSIIERAAVAQMVGDSEGFAEALREAIRFSTKNPTVPITAEVLRNAVKRRQEKMMASVNGVTVDPKLASQIYSELGIDPMQ